MSDPIQPPGTTERVRAASALVVAPHYDDEVLGCGGLVAQLAGTGGGGAVVRVLFLSDGGGGTEVPEETDREAYRRRRREEAARAGEALGIAGSDHLDLPDGALGERLEAIEQGLARALLGMRPELLLVPSPLEVSRDHRAAFAAVHRLLSAARADPAGELPWAGLSILLYEVNHPAYPDLLVDVSAEAPRLAAAMACYASQEERHGYLDAALGVRRFRTLTLPKGVELAEGYRRLAVADFATRSLAQLVRHLGGLPEILAVSEGPKISVVVRTKDRPALLQEALASLAEGAYRRAEVVLVNDGGDTSARPEVPAEYPLPVVRVDLPETRGRAAAAQAGVEAASGDFVAFLDDDDLAAPEHLATLAGLVSAAGVRIAYTDAAVGVYELDARKGGKGGQGEAGWVCRERRLPYSRDFDPDVLLVDNYIPFNTLLIERRLFAEVGPFDLALPFFEDWDLLIRLAARVPFHHLARVTCEYRHFRRGGHHIFGERPRERGDFLAVKARVLAKHAALLSPEALARAVDRLRADAVLALEARDAARRETGEIRRELLRSQEGFARELAERGNELSSLGWQLQESRWQLVTLRTAHEELSRERLRCEELYHETNGRLAAREQELALLAAEARRLYGEEEKLRAAVAEENAHLERTYAEIERLNRLIREMESTRAWRAHRWLERKKP
jgi:LmbE family N-acetylglucosaminyl deacetylase/glycosyltransferase involved in cell wall biosynthesis